MSIKLATINANWKKKGPVPLFCIFTAKIIILMKKKNQQQQQKQ